MIAPDLYRLQMLARSELDCIFNRHAPGPTGAALVRNLHLKIASRLIVVVQIALALAEQILVEGALLIDRKQLPQL